MICDLAISALDYWRSRSGRAPYKIYGVEFSENDTTENPEMMPEMIIAATAGKVFDGGCHCGPVRFRVTEPVGKILICHYYDCMRTAGLGWAGIDAAVDRFDLVKDASLKWYDSSTIATRGFCGDFWASLFY